MSSLDYLDLCRLCLVKDRVSVPIFEGEGDVRQIFLKIAACLPVKVTREDKLPKKICDDCVYKVELFYQFWNTTANAEKQLLQWLGEVNIEDKQGYVTNVLNPNVMKQEQRPENRLDGNVMQQVGEHQNNMGMGMMDNMGLGIPMMISNANQQQQITSVPMDTSGNSVQPVQAVPGPSSQTTHNQISQNQSSSTQQEDEEESSEDEENSDDECDGDEGLPVKEESEEDPNNRTIEPTTFVNVSLACDEAGPSGLQQKISDIPEMPMPQTADGDPKTGVRIVRQQTKQDKCSSYYLIVVPASKHEDEKTTPEGQSNAVSSINFNQPVSKDPLEVHKESTEKSENQLSSESSQKGDAEVDDVLAKIKNICPFCGKRFINDLMVEDHVAIVHCKPYKCDMCKKAYQSERALEKHKVIHQPDYFFKCDICNAKFKKRYSVKRHNLRVHTGDDESKFVCEHCGRRYKVKTDLTLHVKKAHNSEPQVCRFCGKTVIDISGHEWKHRKRNKELKYEHHCHLCNKKFRQRIILDNHLRLHEEGFKCEECGQKHRSSQELINHRKLKHREPKSYLCTICQKTFACTSNFYQHVLTHAGVRPYKCDICDEDFTQRSSMLRHRRQHPGPLPPMEWTPPHVAEVAKSYLQNMQGDQVDKNNDEDGNL
ncbi:zinc finger and SCAN domain-containing protein 12-like isoform X11 [Osmia bicornis bicornis]|uniref:zinc finger and SCAN domain-containing protein 12-like isoform X11 n=1 Tax=Osmia bicornis bicornis TaxID=1437191 RepID=UPI001EAF1D64|nr:zinc finger and SCAN domain-containing protein 12-like isoform X11 [Osmia bicornis bicornis]